MNRIAIVLTVSLLLSIGATAQTEFETFLYPMDFAPYAETAKEIAEREAKLVDAWDKFFQKLDVAIKDPQGKDFAALVKSRSSRDLMVLVNDYGYEALRAPALAKAKAAYQKQIALAATVLAKAGIKDIGDVANLNVAMHEAVVLHEAGQFTPELSQPLEEILSQYVEGKSIFWALLASTPTTCRATIRRRSRWMSDRTPSCSSKTRVNFAAPLTPSMLHGRNSHSTAMNLITRRTTTLQ